VVDHHSIFIRTFKQFYGSKKESSKEGYKESSKEGYKESSKEEGFKEEAIIVHSLST
jgi:hypothetical protein